jgi:hypothetical protein
MDEPLMAQSGTADVNENHLGQILSRMGYGGGGRADEAQLAMILSRLGYGGGNV